MLEAVKTIIDSLMPLFVAVVTVYGGIMVAKLNKVQKETQATNARVAQVQNDIITNHGSKNLGDAVDRLTTHVNVMSDNQDDLIATVKGMQSRDEALEARMNATEHALQRFGYLPTPRRGRGFFHLRRK
ncbi:membrane protein [Microbacterium phage MonChoix]|uniref:Membrane protein n=1 Tax=Microbacterium phage MonChoix TaxID=2590880 RepID=A0A4Y6EL41_9CAUD|nr:membrane protein [Microbacterium phage MonChoix]QDF15989.1 membrane protein [Microbacterium phage MonChoix]